MAELATKITAPGRALVPEPGRWLVARAIHPLFEVATHQVHRLGMARLRRDLVQLECRPLVWRHATAGGQQVGVVVKRPVQPRLGGLAVLQAGQGAVHRPAPAVFPAAPQHIAGHQVTRIGCDLKPALGQHRVALNALAVEQNLPEQGLAIDDALLGGD